MKQRVAIMLLTLILAGLTLSCFNKKEENANNNTEQSTSTDITQQNGTSSEIFNLGQNNNQKEEANTITNLTVEEQQTLINNQIDPSKVSEAITKAEAGEKEAIMSLAQLYYGLKDMDKVKKYLQIGVNKNYPEAIYNLAVVYKNEGKKAESEKLLAKLPKGSVSGNLPAGAEEYNKGIDYVKSKKYDLAKKEFEKAYNKGIKDADIRIALINKEQKKYDEALKWFKIANKRGLKGTDYEIGAILFDTGKTTEARPYLEKAYNSGSKNLAMPIAISYDKEGNSKEALKWYKLAAKAGDSDAKKIVAEIENPSNVDKTINDVATSINNSTSTVNTSNTINSNNSNNVSNGATEKIEKLQKTESNIPTEKTKTTSSTSTSKEKGTYNIGVDEIMKE